MTLLIWIHETTYFCDMPRVFGFFLFFLFAYFGMMKTYILIHYVVNYSYYTNVLCENKDKPQMACRGKCKLNRELSGVEQQTEQKQDHALNKLVQLEFTDYVLPTERNFIFYAEIILEAPSHRLSSCPLLPGFFSSLYRPPGYC